MEQRNSNSFLLLPFGNPAFVLNTDSNRNAFWLAVHTKIAVYVLCGNDYSSWLYRSQDSTNWERTFSHPYRNYIISHPHRCRNPQKSAECQKFWIFLNRKDCLGFSLNAKIFEFFGTQGILFH